MVFEQSLVVLVFHDEDKVGPRNVCVFQPATCRRGEATRAPVDVVAHREHFLGGWAPPAILAADEENPEHVVSRVESHELMRLAET